MRFIRTAAAAAAAAILAAGCASSAPAAAPAARAATPPEKIVTIPVQPPTTAKAVAQKLGGSGFHGGGPAADGLVLDSGSFYVHSGKYAVDVFPSRAARDAWLKIAANYGVRPHWETSTWVVYPSVG